MVSLLIQHPPDNTGKNTSRKLEYLGQLPRLTAVEKSFVSQLITNTSKDVS